MPATCLSVAGPPPHCGHKPTDEHPVCVACQSSYDDYVRRTQEKAIRDAERVLRAAGYIVTKP